MVVVVVVGGVMAHWEGLVLVLVLERVLVLVLEFGLPACPVERLVFAGAPPSALLAHLHMSLPRSVDLEACAFFREHQFS